MRQYFANSQKYLKGIRALTEQRLDNSSFNLKVLVVFILRYEELNTCPKRMKTVDSSKYELYKDTNSQRVPLKYIVPLSRYLKKEHFLENFDHLQDPVIFS